MSRRTLYLLILAALTISLALVSSAPAEPYHGPGCYGCGHGYSLYGREYIPYFAQHPPVYYSYPVPRPYGWSPYAYPPGVMTPPAKLAAPVQPATIRNPFVEQPETDNVSDQKVAQTKPLVIDNPYYLAGDNASEAGDAIARSARAPLSVSNPHYRD